MLMTYDVMLMAYGLCLCIDAYGLRLCIGAYGIRLTLMHDAYCMAIIAHHLWLTLMAYV